MKFPNSVRVAVLVHLAAAYAVMGCAAHKTVVGGVFRIEDLNSGGDPNTAYFAQAMRQEPQWEEWNEHGSQRGLYTVMLDKLKGDLMSCYKLRQDAKAFDFCTDVISDDYGVLAAIKDDLERNPHHI